MITTEEPSTETPAWATSTESTNESTTGWGDATSSHDTTTTTTTNTETTTTDSWSAPAPVRKVNTATIPAGSKMSWAKIVKYAKVVMMAKSWMLIDILCNEKEDGLLTLTI